jgi:glycosyltransferase involved in cell wall biosynthesis
MVRGAIMLKDPSPKVSVLLVTYNHADFIRDCLDSVLQQEYNELEIVVADDCSSDATPEIIKEYAKSYPGKIKPILADRNRGITINSNRALSACTGEFIATLNGDDLFYPEKLRRQVELMVANPECNVSFHPVRVFDNESGKTICIAEQGMSNSSLHDLITRNFLPYSSVILRKSACPERGFDERLPVVSDWLFFIKSARDGPILCLEGIYGAYRRHSRNVSNNSLLAESLRTLEIVNAEMPGYAKAVRKGTVNMYVLEGERLFRQGKSSAARCILMKGIAAGPGNMKPWRWFLATFLGRWGMRRSIKVWNDTKSFLRKW